MRKICIVTGTRAEWGILSRLAGLIKEDDSMELQIVATNMHLSPEFGLTYKNIEEDGFTIDRKVNMLLSGDTSNAITKSIGLATIGFADAFEDLKPDALLLLGDRYEILAAATAALIYKIPIIHLHGGEITEGAYDDSIRHAITKMSHLHFTSTEAYRKRVIQLGEKPENVFNVGALGVENIRQLSLLSKEETEKSLDHFKIDRDTWLITYHPVTLSGSSAEEQFQELLKALECFPRNRIVFTLPNSDTGGRKIIEMIKNWVDGHRERSIWFTSLGLTRYLSVLQYIGAAIGNSSSGIIEVPSFNIYTLNIGDRQKGRIAADSVIHCGDKKEEIISKLRYIAANPTIIRKINNPYEQEKSAERIIEILKKHSFHAQKEFYNIPL